MKVGKYLRGFRPVLTPNFVPTSRHLALTSSARPSLVNDDHGLVSVTMNANSTWMVIGEKAAVMIAEGCGKRNKGRTQKASRTCEGEIVL